MSRAFLMFTISALLLLDVTRWKISDCLPCEQGGLLGAPSILLDAPPSSKKRSYHYNDPPQVDENTFQGVTARAFVHWEGDLPCFPPRAKTAKRSQGFLFCKTSKTASTTTKGVQLRIAINEARRRNLTYARCDGSYHHGLASQAFPNRDTQNSFMWTILRDPTSRLVSQTFFHYVSREGQKPLDSGFIQFIQQEPRDWKYNHYMDWLSSEKRFMPAEKDPVAHANAIMREYNFMAVTERLDESLVALAMLINVPLSDVLYLSGAGKGSGGFDDGLSKGGCTYIVPSFVSPGMEAYFRSEDWQAKVRWDHVLHQAANRSLDLTIEQTLGRQKFQSKLGLFLKAKKLGQERCLSRTVFPCSPGGGPQRRQKTDCIDNDHACGYKCLDKVAEELGLFLPIHSY